MLRGNSMRFLKTTVWTAACLAIASLPARGLTTDDWKVGANGIVVDCDSWGQLSYPCPFDLVSALASANPWVLRSISVGPDRVSLYCAQADGPVYFTGPDGRKYFWMHSDYTLSLTRALRLGAGMTVSGWAEFGSEDWPGYGDYAAVRVNGRNIWRFDLNDLGTSTGGDPEDPFGAKSGGLRRWSVTAPEEGVYSLSLSIYGDDQLDSRVTFGGMQVPDAGTSVLFLGIGVVGVLGLARKLSRSGLQDQGAGRPKTEDRFL
jgi:hypothetical protein